MEDYYKVLGVAYDDPPGKIRARYRLLALTLHPDMAGVGLTTEFAQYAQAYRILGRPYERQRYNEALGILVRPRPLLPGTDLYQRVAITPVQAESGAVVPLSFLRYEPCSLCWLSGCHRCDGQGMVPDKVSLDVEIMPGTRNNAVVLIEKQGSTSEPGGSRGNLFIYVMIR